jgi:putative transposase
MRYRRDRSEGATYFFAVVTADRRPILVEHVGRLGSAFRLTRERYPFIMDALVVLPDHLHTVWTLPPDDADYSTRWMVLKRAFSSGLPARRLTPVQMHRREKGVWQRRFWEHRIRDEGELCGYIDYIHHNPVKHGYCAAPGEWPYSTFHRMVERGVYARDWQGDEAGISVRFD